MVNLIDWVCKNADLAPDLWASVSGDQVISRTSAGSSNDHDPDGIEDSFNKATFGKLKPDTLAGWLLTIDKGPTKKMLDLIDSHDADAVRDIFTCLMQLKLSD
jgi:hypothetical protein